MLPDKDKHIWFLKDGVKKYIFLNRMPCSAFDPNSKSHRGIISVWQPDGSMYELYHSNNQQKLDSTMHLLCNKIVKFMMANYHKLPMQMQENILHDIDLSGDINNLANA